MRQIAGWLLGFDNVRSIDSVDFSLAAPWASQNQLIVPAVCIAAVAIAVPVRRAVRIDPKEALRE